MNLTGISASFRQQQSQAQTASAQLRRADAQLQTFRQALEASSSPADLEARFTALHGPRFDALDRRLSMPQLRLCATALLDQLAVELKRRRSRLPSANPWNKVPEIGLTALGGLVLAAGFAALARRPGQEVPLLEEPLLALALWDERHQLQRETRGIGPRRSAPPEEDYIRELSGEQDELPGP